MVIRIGKLETHVKDLFASRNTRRKPIGCHACKFCKILYNPDQRDYLGDDDENTYKSPGQSIAFTCNNPSKQKPGKKYNFIFIHACPEVASSKGAAVSFFKIVYKMFLGSKNGGDCFVPIDSKK